ncbi:MFS transporter [Thermodesulfobacteriota bacterium]
MRGNRLTLQKELSLVLIAESSPRHLARVPWKEERPKLNHSERRILVVTCFGHFMSHFNMLVFPALVLPLSQKLNMGMPQVLGLSFWMYLLFGITALPWGMLGDKLGGKPIMLIMFLGAGLSGLATAMFLDSPLAFSIGLAGIGLFSGIYHPIGLGLISKGVGRLSLAMGYNAVFGGLGLVVAPLVTGIINWISGPKAAYLLLAGLNLVGLVMMALLPLGDEVKKKGTQADKGNGMVEAFLILLVAMMLGGIAYRGSTVILPAYLQLNGKAIFEAVSGVFGQDLSANVVATTVAAAVYTVGMIGQYVGGHVGDRFEHRVAYLTFHTICIPAAFLMAFTQNFALVGFAFVYFFFLLGMQPVENTLVATFTPKRLHHSAYGMKFILTFGVGALAVKMVQWIEVRWGSDATWIALGFISVLIVMTIIVLIARTSPSRRQQPETSEGLPVKN